MTRNEEQSARFQAEPSHTVRSVGRSVGLPMFRNTNRPKPLYKRRANRLARKAGFQDHAHLTVFLALMAKHRAAKAGK